MATFADETITAKSGATTSTSTGTVKLTVALPRDAVDAVEELAAARHKSKTAILREAIALKIFVEEELQAKNRFLVERDGEVREIFFT